MGCLSKLSANDYNFIQWYKATSVVLDDLPEGVDCCTPSITYDIPNNLVTRPWAYSPTAIIGQLTAFYANLDSLINDADFSDWRLGIYNIFGSQEVANASNLFQDSFTGGFRFYVNSFSFPVLDKGSYRFVIYNTSTEDVKYISNWFNVRESSEKEKYCYLVYRHSNSLFNFNYTDLNNFYNRIFIDANLIEDQPEIELEPYPAVSTGIVQNPKSYAKQVWTLETGFFDKYARNAMLALSIHNKILINGHTVQVKEAYQTIASRANNTKRGTILFYNQAVSTINLAGYDE